MLCRQRDGQCEGRAELRAEDSGHWSGTPQGGFPSPGVLETHQMVLPETGLLKVKLAFSAGTVLFFNPQTTQHCLDLLLSGFLTLFPSPVLSHPRH